MIAGAKVQCMSKSPKSSYRGRIAPTPSGYLHLGHARTFSLAHRRAREAGGTLVLRIEDIDSARCRDEYLSQAYSDLKKCGLDWDEGPDIGGPYAPYLQSRRTDYYWSLMEKLIEQGQVYPCNASRAEIRSRCNKSEAENEDYIFPEELRPVRWQIPSNPQSSNWRFAVAGKDAVVFEDDMCGNQALLPGKDFGDFLVWRKSGEPSYDLAVVADDIAMKITHVVRGEDLITATARHILLYRAFGEEPPRYTHCPLLKNPDGTKISKSVIGGECSNPLLIKNACEKSVAEIAKKPAIHP